MTESEQGLAGYSAEMARFTFSNLPERPAKEETCGGSKQRRHMFPVTATAL
jgi:hypothetical protein